MLALLWMWMLDPNLGIVNHWLNAIGISSQGFLGSEGQVIPTIAGINIWKNMGYTALLLFGGLVMIPKSYYEAASLDGASEWRMFRTITLPLLRPVLALVLVVTVIGSFQVFDTIQIATAGIGGGNPGGPGNASRVLYMYIFQQAFEFNALGYASALAVALILLLVIVAAIQMRCCARTNPTSHEGRRHVRPHRPRTAELAGTRHRAQARQAGHPVGPDRRLGRDGAAAVRQPVPVLLDAAHRAVHQRRPRHRLAVARARRTRRC